MLSLDPESQGNTLCLFLVTPPEFTAGTRTLSLLQLSRPREHTLCHSPAQPPPACSSQALNALESLPLCTLRVCSVGLWSTGSRLLSADADGQIKCWSMADHLANSWESSVGSLVEGDPIVALSWLHNGVKLALHVEKVGVHPSKPEPLQ